MAALELAPTIAWIFADVRPFPAAEAAGAWRKTCADNLKPGMTTAAARLTNDVCKSTGLLPTKGFIAALNRLVDEHCAAIAAYADLVDGVAYVGAQRGTAEDDVAAVLGEDRAERILETEERHLRSGVVMLLSSLGGVEAQAAVV